MATNRPAALRTHQRSGENRRSIATPDARVRSRSSESTTSFEEWLESSSPCRSFARLPKEPRGRVTVRKRRQAADPIDIIAARLRVARDDVAEAIDHAVFVVAGFAMTYGAVLLLGFARVNGWW